MRSSIRLFVLAGCVFAAAVGMSAQAPPAGQAPAAPGQGARPGGAGAALQNIKVLPKTWTRQQVGGLMQAFVKSLGVENCGHCHAPAPGTTVQPGQPVRYAYELDDKPEKEIARKMISMVMKLNGDLSALGDTTKAEKVSCFTCHQGQKTPAYTPSDGWGRGNPSLLETPAPAPVGRGPGPTGAAPAGPAPAGPARGN